MMTRFSFQKFPVQKLLNLTLAATLLGGTMLATTGCDSPLGAMVKVATIDGQVVNKNQYDKAYKQMMRMFAGQGGIDMKEANNPYMQEMLKQNVLNKLVMDALLQADAKRAGVTITGDDLNKFKAAQMMQVGGEEAFNKLLKENNMSMDDFTTLAKERLLVEKFTLKQAEAAGQGVKEADLEKYYKSNTAQFDLPPSIRASHILIKSVAPEIKAALRKQNPKITDAELNKQVQAQRAVAKQKAEQLLAEVQKNPSQFEALAKQHSQDTMSAIKGGDLDFMPQQATVPEFWNAMKATPKGQLNPHLVETMFGYHILKVVDTKPAGHMSLAEAKPKIAEMLMRQKSQAFMQQWMSEKQAAIQAQKIAINIEPNFQPKPMPQQQQPSGQAGVHSMPIKPEPAQKH